MLKKRLAARRKKTLSDMESPIPLSKGPVLSTIIYHHYICLHHASVFVSVSKHPLRDNKTFPRDDVHDFPRDTGKTTIFSQIIY
jgi:hypothetical protein